MIPEFLFVLQVLLWRQIGGVVLGCHLGAELGLGHSDLISTLASLQPNRQRHGETGNPENQVQEINIGSNEHGEGLRLRLISNIQLAEEETNYGPKHNHSDLGDPSNQQASHIYLAEMAPVAESCEEANNRYTDSEHANDERVQPPFIHVAMADIVSVDADDDECDHELKDADDGGYDSSCPAGVPRIRKAPASATHVDVGCMGSRREEDGCCSVMIETTQRESEVDLVFVVIQRSRSE